MSRFFTTDIDREGGTARITGEDVRHIARVLRLGAGDAVELCDGAGTEYAAVIASVRDDQVTLTVDGGHPSPAEPRCRVTLYQGFPKTGKLETVIQKCTEIGIDSVVPVEMVRCVAQPKEFSKKLDRYQRVAEEAAKQSRRGMIPEVRDCVRLKDIPADQYDLLLIPYEGEHQRTLKSVLTDTAVTPRDRRLKIAVVIGPEGGFEPDEVELLVKQGGIPVTLGSRILRTETAGPAVLAQILYELE